MPIPPKKIEGCALPEQVAPAALTDMQGRTAPEAYRDEMARVEQLVNELAERMPGAVFGSHNVNWANVDTAKTLARRLEAVLEVL